MKYRLRDRGTGWYFRYCVERKRFGIWWTAYETAHIGLAKRYWETDVVNPAAPGILITHER